MDSPVQEGPESSPGRRSRPPIFSLPSARSIRTTRFADDAGEADESSRLLGRTASEAYLEQSVGQYGAAAGDSSEPRGWTKRTSLWAKAKYYVPSLYWIPNYSLSYVGGDLLAGLTVAAMLIPQSVSYASSLAKLNPVTGLFAASIPPIIYALLGTSRQLNVAPEAALSLLVGQAVSDVLHGHPHEHSMDPDAVGIAVCTAIVAQVGVISFLLGFFRLGFLDVVLSRALLRGFITAVAFVIFLEQLIPMLGLVALEHKLNPQTTMDKIRFLLENGFTHFHRRTAMVSFGALLVLVGARFFKAAFKKYWFIYRIPEVLVVVIVSTILSDKFNWDEDGIDILGSVPINTGKHFFKFPLHHSHLPYYKQTTSYAVLISIIGFLDSIVAAKQNASRFGYSISPNRELVALGAANLMGSFVPGTLPAYGSITRSRINADVGGRTQMASIFCAAIVLLATFFLLPWLYYLPKCVLGSIICLVVFSLLAETPEDVHYYWKMRAWIDLLLMTLTFVLTIVWSVQVGVVVSMVISLLLVVRRSSKPRMTILGRIRGTDRWKPVDETAEAEEDMPGTLIVRIRENLDFANTAQLKERLRRLELYGLDPSHPSEEPRRQEAHVLIFHMSDVGTCDASAVQIFYELFKEYKERGVDVYITHLRPGPRHAFERAGIDKLLGEDAFYHDVATAVSRVASGADLSRFVDA